MVVASQCSNAWTVDERINKKVNKLNRLLLLFSVLDAEYF